MIPKTLTCEDLLEHKENPIFKEFNLIDLKEEKSNSDELGDNVSYNSGENSERAEINPESNEEDTGKNDNDVLPSENKDSDSGDN